MKNNKDKYINNLKEYIANELIEKIGNISTTNWIDFKYTIHPNDYDKLYEYQIDFYYDIITIIKDHFSNSAINIDDIKIYTKNNCIYVKNKKFRKQRLKHLFVDMSIATALAIIIFCLI